MGRHPLGNPGTHSCWHMSALYRAMTGNEYVHMDCDVPALAWGDTHDWSNNLQSATLLAPGGRDATR